VSTATTSRIKGLDMSYVLTTNPQKSIAFYRDVLGLTVTQEDSEGRGAEFELADGTTFGVWDGGEGKTGAGVMFAVDDIKAASEEFRARGLHVTPTEESPVCHMAFAMDPDGNAFIIHQRKK
jgi:predicted enzyme related to lactoylglutathione lyase